MINLRRDSAKILSVHGYICDSKKVVSAIEFMADKSNLTVEQLNKISESGGIYISYNGEILQDYDKQAEAKATYKIVPTGLKLKHTDYPLFASFIKLSKFWEGTFIGTGQQLFAMYKEHCKSGEFNDEHMKLFTGEGRSVDIRGFGLKALNSKSDLVHEAIKSEVSAKENRINELEVALLQCNKEIGRESNSSKLVKLKTKKTRLEKQILKLDPNYNKRSKDTETVDSKELEESAKISNELYTEVCDCIIEKVVGENLANIEESIVNEAEEHKDYDGEAFINIDGETKHINKENEAVVMKSKTKDTDDIEQRRRFKYQFKNSFADEVYEKIMFKDSWKSVSKVRNKVAYYLKNTMLVTEYNRMSLGDKHRGNGYMYSADKSKCLVNTGLLDTFCNFIYIIDHTPNIGDYELKTMTIMKNKIELIDIGFSVEDIKKLPDVVKFVECKSQLVFNGKIEDFDLTDDEHLKHIVLERRERFGRKLKEETEVNLCNKITAAIQQAIKVSKTDHGYIVPKYDFYRHNLQFLVPLHLETKIYEKPELAIVIGKEKGIWSIYTVLNIEDAYDDARLICKPPTYWE